MRAISGGLHERRGPRPLVEGDPRVEITVDVERKIHQTQNVLGLLEGSDPSLKKEVMVVGAHYDHDGTAYGQIWYGADDNGSGTAALLELAEALGNGAARPARVPLRHRVALWTLPRLLSFPGTKKAPLARGFFVVAAIER